MKGKKGFTLVELAVVLVIIGFLLAMTMKGTELIRSAKLQKEAYKFKKIAAAIGTYYNKYSNMPGDWYWCGWMWSNGSPRELVQVPQDGIIQFRQSGCAIGNLEGNQLIDDDTKKINDIRWVFSAASLKRIDRRDTGDGWVWIYEVDPGAVWFNKSPSTPRDYGTGSFTALVLMDYTARTTRTYECYDSSGNPIPDPASCSDCASGGDSNGDGDCKDHFDTYDYDFRAGAPDQNLADLDNKIDPNNYWAGGNLRGAYVADKNYQGSGYQGCDSKNECYNDRDSDGYIEFPIDGSAYIYWNPNNPKQPLAAYRIW